jgi:hypothetical protein
LRIGEETKLIQCISQKYHRYIISQMLRCWRFLTLHFESAQWMVMHMIADSMSSLVQIWGEKEL